MIYTFADDRQLLPTDYSRSSYQSDIIGYPLAYFLPLLISISTSSSSSSLVFRLHTSSSSLIIFAHYLHCLASSSALVFLRRSSSSIAHLHHFFVRAFQVLIIPAFPFVYSCFPGLFLHSLPLIAPFTLNSHNSSPTVADSRINPPCIANMNSQIGRASCRERV